MDLRLDLTVAGELRSRCRTCSPLCLPPVLNGRGSGYSTFRCAGTFPESCLRGAEGIVGGRREKGRLGRGCSALCSGTQQERSVKDFTIQDFYHRFEAELAQRYPHNRKIRPKVRQQLQ